MKKSVRILFPKGCKSHGIDGFPGGSVVEIEAELADLLIHKQYAEEVKVEKMTAAPGEKHEVSPPRKYRR